MQLISAGTFEQEKALLSLQTNPADISGLKPRSVADVFQNPTPTLATIKKYRGDIILNSVITKLLHWLADGLNVGQHLNDTQIEVLCELIYEEFYFFTIADIKLVFKKGLKGEYGPLYNRLDTQIVMEWLSEYQKERAAYNPEPEPEPVKPVDQEQVKKLTEGLEKIARAKVAKKKTSFKFQTLESWAMARGINFTEWYTPYFVKWEKEYNATPQLQQRGIDIEMFITLKKAKLLLELNDKEPK